MRIMMKEAGQWLVVLAMVGMGFALAFDPAVRSESPQGETGPRVNLGGVYSLPPADLGGQASRGRITPGMRPPAPSRARLDGLTAPGGKTVMNVWLQGGPDCMPAFEAWRGLVDRGKRGAGP